MAFRWGFRGCCEPHGRVRRCNPCGPLTPRFINLRIEGWGFRPRQGDDVTDVDSFVLQMYQCSEVVEQDEGIDICRNEDGDPLFPPGTGSLQTPECTYMMRAPNCNSCASCMIWRARFSNQPFSNQLRLTIDVISSGGAAGQRIGITADFEVSGTSCLNFNEIYEEEWLQLIGKAPDIFVDETNPVTYYRDVPGICMQNNPARDCACTPCQEPNVQNSNFATCFSNDVEYYLNVPEEAAPDDVVL